MSQLTPIQKITNWSKLSDGRGKFLYTRIGGKQIMLKDVQYTNNKLKFTYCEPETEECDNFRNNFQQYKLFFLKNGDYQWEIPVPTTENNNRHLNEFWNNLSLNYGNGGRLRPLSIKKKTRFRNIQKNKQTRRSSKMRSK